MIARALCHVFGHRYEWLPADHWLVSGLGGIGRPVNVECKRCGARTWAHGRRHASRPPTASTGPTTDRRG